MPGLEPYVRKRKEHLEAPSFFSSEHFQPDGKWRLSVGDDDDDDNDDDDDDEDYNNQEKHDDDDVNDDD